MEETFNNKFTINLLIIKNVGRIKRNNDMNLHSYNHDKISFQINLYE